MNTFELTLDLDKSVGVKQWITLRQGDKRGTTLQATLYDHGVLVSGSYTCRVSIRHPNRNTYYRETATYSNGVATVTIDETSAASVVGVTEGYFELLQGSAVIASTESFGVRVLQSATDGATVGPPYDSAIQDALDELDAATGRISQMVVDATAEYLAAHPEITTTVQDNSVTDAKLIQSGGVLDRVGRLWWRLENLLTNTPAEAESVTVSDAAKTPVAGLTVFGKSTQDGTPTPDAPVAIESVTPNLYRQTFYAAGATHSTAGITVTHNADGTCTCSGTATANAWLWGGNSSANAAYYVELPAGTYTACGSQSVAVQKMVDGTVSPIAGTTAGSATFTLDEPTLVKAVPVIPNGTTVVNTTAWVAVYAGDTWHPYVPYANVGLWARGRNLLDSKGTFRKATTSFAGCTITNNGDGTYTLSGTNAQSNNWLFHSGTGRRRFNAGTYTLSNGGATLSGCYIGIETSIGTFRIEEGTKYTFTANLPFVVTEWHVMVIGSAAVSGTASPMLELGTTAHAYEPYTESVTALPTDGHTLRSLPNGTRDEVTVDQYGHVTLVERVGSADMGALNYTRITNGSVYLFDASVSTMKSGDPANNLMCSGYEVRTSTGYGLSDKQLARSTGARELYFRNDAYTDAASFKAAMGGIEVQYALATPVTHDLGTIDPTALVGPDMTAQAVPTAPFVLTYERDLNATLARLEAALATLA